MGVRSDVGTSPWIVSDELRDHLEPLLPQRERRFRYVLHTGFQWEYLPQELRFGSA